MCAGITDFPSADIRLRNEANYINYVVYDVI
jgi:hypothetical protein